MRDLTSGGLSHDFFGQAVENKAIFLGSKFVLRKGSSSELAVRQCNIANNVLQVFSIVGAARRFGRIRSAQTGENPQFTLNWQQSYVTLPPQLRSNCGHNPPVILILP